VVVNGDFNDAHGKVLYNYMLSQRARFVPPNQGGGDKNGRKKSISTTASPEESISALLKGDKRAPDPNEQVISTTGVPHAVRLRTGPKKLSYNHLFKFRSVYEEKNI